ncbi:MAG: hypothetical protein ABSB00_00655 [Minisyncoccia bacterium]|jgi:hypothetical protein
MSYKHFWVAAAILALVLAASFALSVPHTRDIIHAPPQTETASIPLVTAHDSFKKGLHTITGSLNAPNACTIVTAQATLLGNASSTRGILVALSMPEDIGVCLQLPTLMNFSATISASAHLPLTVTVNGSVASTSIL